MTLENCAGFEAVEMTRSDRSEDDETDNSAGILKWWDMRWSHSGEFSGRINSQESIGHFLSVNTVLHIVLRMVVAARVPSVPWSRAISQNFIQALLLSTRAT